MKNQFKIFENYLKFIKFPKHALIFEQLKKLFKLN